MTAQHEKLREDLEILFLTLSVIAGRARHLGVSEDDLRKLAQAGALMDEVRTALGRPLDGAP